MKILWINPIGTNIFDDEIYSRLLKIKYPESDIEVVSLRKGKPLHLEYHSYEALVAPDIIRIVRNASNKGFDAAIIGCFYDTAIRESREISRHMVIVGPCQSSLSIAANLGNTFSVLVGRKKWIPRIKENIILYGQEHKLASIRALNLSVDDIDRKRNVTFERMVFEGRLAIEQDGAEVLVLGCTAAIDYAESLQHELNVPVVDSFVIPFKYAEMLASLVSKFDLYPSRIFGSEPPPPEELDLFI